MRDIFTPQVEKTNIILPIEGPLIETVKTVTEFARLPLNPLLRLLSLLGPGLITGASDDDPSGIATYSVAGAQFGYKTLWLALVTYPLSAAVQEVCARIGLVTGHGLAAVAKKHYSKTILFIIVFLLVTANVINIGADLQAMAATLQLVLPKADFSLLAVGITILTLFLLIALPYKSYARYLKLVAVVLFSYVFVALVSGVNWHDAFREFFIPTISFSPAYLMTLVGILGTTISPYMFFWQANEEVEEHIAHGIIRKDGPETQHPQLLKIARRIITSMYIDVNVGMFYSELIMFFIIIATAATLFHNGTVQDVSQLSLQQLANVLRPLVGDTAFLLFTIGIVGIGMLAIPVLAGSASYATAELFGWQQGLNKKFSEAKGFYLVIIFATGLGLLLNFIGIAPVAALYYSAVLNGVVAVPLLFIIWRIGNNKKILGHYTSGWLSNLLMGATFLLMLGAAVAMIVVR